MFLKALAGLLLGFIVQEAPKVQKSEKAYTRFSSGIERLVQVHGNTVAGCAERGDCLINSKLDLLLLASVNYRESRMMDPSPEGDCRRGHRLDHLPSGSWPAGYKPSIHVICNAVGPMQLNKGAGYQAQLWPEVRQEFPDRDWKKDPLDAKELKDSAVSSKMGYAVLKHWKSQCTDAEGAAAPVGVWLTAYRYGRCPGKRGKYHVDAEAKLRCDMTNELATSLAKDPTSGFGEAQVALCTYPKKT